MSEEACEVLNEAPYRRPMGRPREHEFPDEIDWGQPYHKLADQFGCAVPTIRSEFVRRHPDTRKHIRIVPRWEKESWQKYKAWDWGRIDVELGREHGVTREMVRQIRKGLGLPSSKELWAVDWAAVDWSKSDEQIMRETSNGKASVQQRRKEHAPDSIPPQDYVRRYWHEKLDALTPCDWKLRRREIMAKFPEMTRGYLMSYLMAHPRLHKYSRWHSAERYAKVKWEWSNEKIAKKLNILPISVEQYRKRHHPETCQRRRPKYVNVDLSLSNAQNGRIYGITAQSFSNVRSRIKKERGLK